MAIKKARVSHACLFYVRPVPLSIVLEREGVGAVGAIVITTTEATAVQVYGMTSVCHYNATVSGTATIANLPAGIYIMTAGGETLKIAVR